MSRKSIANDIKIDIDRHKQIIAYVDYRLEGTIVFANNKVWFNKKSQFQRAVSVISHETIHLLCLDIARKDKLNIRDTGLASDGIDNEFRALGGKSMNKGGMDSTGLENLDKLV